MRNTLRAAATLLLLAAPTLAFAHALLQRAEPPVGATVRGAPPQVELNFTEAIEPRFSTVKVTDAAGKQVDRQNAHLDPDDSKRLAVSLGPLPPGVYTVTWHATSVDTHQTEGSFTFTLVP